MKKKLQSCLLVLCCFSLVLPLAEARITRFYQFFQDFVADLDENGNPADVDGPNSVLFKVYVNTRTKNALAFARARITNLTRQFLRTRNVNVGNIFPFQRGNFTVTTDSILISPRGRLDAIFRGTFQ